MRQFRFRAMVTLDPPPQDCIERLYQSGTRHLLVHAQRLDSPALGKYLPAMISSDGGMPLVPGRAEIATITITDDEALAYLGPGQAFTLWGQGGGRGVISRRVFTDQAPS